MPLFKVAKITVMLSVISLLYIASLTNSLATFYGSCSIKGIYINRSFTIFTQSWLEKRSNKPSDAKRTKWSLIGSIVVTRIYIVLLSIYSYLWLNQDEVLDLFIMFIDLYFYVFAVKVAKCTCHCESTEHSSEDYVTALLFYPLLFIMT